MKFFPSAHANGPVWTENAAQVVLQLRAQIQMQPGFVPGLGLLYISDALVPQAQAILEFVAQGLPQVPHWCGAAGGAVLGGDVSYGASPAIGGFLLQAAAEDFYVFSGVTPLSRAPQGFVPELALVHGAQDMPEPNALLADVAAHMRSGQLLGGLSATQLVWRSASAAQGPEQGGALAGGISGLALRGGPWVQVKTVQACRPMGQVWRVTRAQGNVVLELEGQTAMGVLLHALGLPDGLHPLAFAALAHETWIGLSATADEAPQWARLSGLDVVRRGVVLSMQPEPGPLYLQVSQKDLRMAHSELRRACAEVMEELTHSEALSGESAVGPRALAGVLLVRSGAATGLDAGAHMGLDAQLQLIRHAFGPVPLLGWETPHTVTARGLHPAGLQLLVFTQPLQWPSWA